MSWRAKERDHGGSLGFAFIAALERLLSREGHQDSGEKMELVIRLRINRGFGYVWVETTKLPHEVPIVPAARARLSLLNRPWWSLANCESLKGPVWVGNCQLGFETFELLLWLTPPVLFVFQSCVVSIS